jgi:excisionase family DNA binding protein
MTAFALGDEHPPLTKAQVRKPQPENLAAAQPAQHHRRDHRPVPVRAQRRGQRVHLARVQDPRQRPGHRTKVYELIRSGMLRSVKIGGLRRIPATAPADFVAQLEEQERVA